MQLSLDLPSKGVRSNSQICFAYSHQNNLLSLVVSISNSLYNGLVLELYIEIMIPMYPFLLPTCFVIFVPMFCWQILALSIKLQTFKVFPVKVSINIWRTFQTAANFHNFSPLPPFVSRFFLLLSLSKFGLFLTPSPPIKFQHLEWMVPNAAFINRYKCLADKIVSPFLRVRSTILP